MRLSNFLLIGVLATLGGLALGWYNSWAEPILWGIATVTPFTIYGVLSLATDLWEEYF